MVCLGGCFLLAGCAAGIATHPSTSSLPADARLYYPGSSVVTVGVVNRGESIVGLSAPTKVLESTLMSWYETKVRPRGWTVTHRDDHILVIAAPFQPGARMIVLVNRDLETTDGQAFVQDYSVTYNDPRLWFSAK
jgi:hypothetical protein